VAQGPYVTIQRLILAGEIAVTEIIILEWNCNAYAKIVIQFIVHPTLEWFGQVARLIISSYMY
jgi:hypothetical protein